MRKTRAVLIGTNMFPFLMRYWFELFKRFWQDEVDQVYIAVSNPEHTSVWPYMQKLLESHPKIKVFHTGVNWPSSVNQVAREIKEDLILVAHDDTLIYKSGVLDMYFNMLEKEDRIITPITPIFTPKDVIEELMHRKWPDQVPFKAAGTNAVGYSFYCNFFFLTRKQLHTTSINFGVYEKKIGEYCPLLDWTPLSQPFRSDTNFLFCLELLNGGAKFHPIEKQEFVSVYNTDNALNRLYEMLTKKEVPFTGAGWVHLQSMAFQIHELYYDLREKEALEEKMKTNVFPKIHRYGAHRLSKPTIWSYVIRLAWMLEFIHYSDDVNLHDYRQHALKEMKYIMIYFGIPARTLFACRDIFHKLIWNQ